MLDRYFSAEQQNLINSGIHTYIRLMATSDDPTQAELDMVCDESDLHLELDAVARAVKATQPMVGMSKYKGVPFNVTSEVKKDMMMFLTSGRTDSETIMLKKRNTPMYYLVIAPVLDGLKYHDHQFIIDNIDQIVKCVQSLVWSSNSYGTLDDAIVARSHVRQLIRRIEQDRIDALPKRKARTKSKRDQLIEMFEEVLAEDVEISHA